MVTTCSGWVDIRCCCPFSDIGAAQLTNTVGNFRYPLHCLPDLVQFTHAGLVRSH
jgi:hypothetical protein